MKRALLLLFTACGGIHTGLDFCKETARVECKKATDCAIPTTETCLADITAACCNAPGLSCGSEVTPEAARGGQRCLDAVAASSCADFLDFANGKSRPLACD